MLLRSKVVWTTCGRRDNRGEETQGGERGGGEGEETCRDEGTGKLGRERLPRSLLYEDCRDCTMSVEDVKLSEDECDLSVEDIYLSVEMSDPAHRESDMSLDDTELSWETK